MNAVNEAQRLQRELDASLANMANLETKLYHARRLIELEQNHRKDAEYERDLNVSITEISTKFSIELKLYFYNNRRERSAKYVSFFEMIKIYGRKQSKSLTF